MKKRLDTDFITQLDQIVAQSKEALIANRNNFISKSAASGTVGSGAFIKWNLDMTISNIVTISDSILRYAIEYASNENLSLKKLIDIAAEKIKSYKISELSELENHNLIQRWLRNDGIRKIFEDEKSKLDLRIAGKIDGAYNGWLNQEKIYKKITKSWHETWWAKHIVLPFLTKVIPPLLLTLFFGLALKVLAT